MPVNAKGSGNYEPSTITAPAPVPYIKQLNIIITTTIHRNVKSFPSHMGPYGGTDLHFCSPLPDTSLCCKIMNGASA